MVRQIVWTDKAQKDRISILDYWNHRNKSINYSKKLNQLFIDSLFLISKYPLIGKRTNIEFVRAKVLKDYMIFYLITDNEIVVLTIWDCRQDPMNIKEY